MNKLYSIFYMQSGKNIVRILKNIYFLILCYSLVFITTQVVGKSLFYYFLDLLFNLYSTHNLLSNFHNIIYHFFYYRKTY